MTVGIKAGYHYLRSQWIWVWFLIPPYHAASISQVCHELPQTTSVPLVVSENTLIVRAPSSLFMCLWYRVWIIATIFFAVCQTTKAAASVQNACAKMVMKCSKCYYITPSLKELHWLLVHARIKYKVIFSHLNASTTWLLLIWQIYLTLYHPARSLHSADTRFIVVPPSGKKHYKNRSFTYAAPLLWNKLPEHMRLIDSTAHLKTVLKTLFFTR